jgi:NDP-sugar pyrophosphorylase family protein
MPVGDYPILEILLKQLAYYGVKEAVLAVNHLASLIETYFGAGDRCNLHLRYSLEDQPLGTAGPLAIMPDLANDFLVLNGDILTNIDFKDLFDFHVSQRNDITIAVSTKTVKDDLGVLLVDGFNLVEYIEKPTHVYYVSTGIYVFNKRVVKLLTPGDRADLPSLVMTAKQKGFRVQCYMNSLTKIWLDIGRPEDYAQATKTFLENRGAFLP